MIEKAKQARPHPGGSLLEGIAVQIPGGNTQVAGMSKVVFTGAAILKAAHNSLNLIDVLVVNGHWLFRHKKKMRRTGFRFASVLLNVDRVFTSRWPDLRESSGAIYGARRLCDEERLSAQLYQSWKLSPEGRC